jgi:hypothetical protein
MALRLLAIGAMQRTLILDARLPRPTTLPLAPLSAVLWGALVTATLDGFEAGTFWALRGVAPGRAFQGIAAGLLGRAAFAGGVATTTLGVALLYFICGVIVATYLVASRRFEELARSPWRWGPLYGVAVFAVMNFVVVPLSAAGGRPPRPAALVNCLLANIVCIGIPAALFARAAAPNGAMASTQAVGLGSGITALRA